MPATALSLPFVESSLLVPFHCPFTVLLLPFVDSSLTLCCLFLACPLPSVDLPLAGAGGGYGFVNIRELTSTNTEILFPVGFAQGAIQDGACYDPAWAPCDGRHASYPESHSNTSIQSRPPVVLFAAAGNPSYDGINIQMDIRDIIWSDGRSGSSIPPSDGDWTMKVNWMA